ncbi:MAG: AAA family ATPase [Spirochaetales bacterium]|nr:AAA family ATPase [Spirochaetales bacterium]
MELFEQAGNTEGQPLAYRMRPRTIDEFFGQDHIVGPGRLLRRMIQADQLSSIIFYGPPGTGKTTLARVIANTTSSAFVTMNAVLSGVKDLRKAIEEAKERKSLRGRRTILFVDEVHRWNKAQQDALLPWVENGTVVLVGATTQNPYFEVISALVSRSRIFQLKPLGQGELRHVAKAALADPQRGYGGYNVHIDENALEHLIAVAGGDARSLLNALELAVETTPPRFPPAAKGEEIRITLEIAEESIQRKALLYDKEGDYHFDTISAFIKSLRGSDPDAAFYWMARMVHSGEDPHFIFRRMLILAAEDVGLADPQALAVVEAAAAAFDRVGMPEGRFHLAQAALYLATAPKSNTTLGFFDALDAVQKETTGEIPSHLKDPSRDKDGFGHGEGYLYPHAYRDHWIAQAYLPDNLRGRIFYNPSESGYEGKVRETIQRRREAQLAAWDSGAQEEILTYSPADKGRDRWLARISSTKSEVLAEIRDTLFTRIQLQRHNRVLVLKADNGLLLWEALRAVPEGGVWGIVDKASSKEILEHVCAAIPESERPILLAGGLPSALAELSAGRVRFETLIGTNVFLREPRRGRVIEQAGELLAPGGVLALAETVPRHGQRLSGYLEDSAADAALLGRFKTAEEAVYSGREKAVGAGAHDAMAAGAAGAASLTDWDEQDLAAQIEASGFRSVTVELRYFEESRVITEKDIQNWFDAAAGSYYGLTMAQYLETGEIDAITALLAATLAGKPLRWKKPVAFLTARR